MTHQFPIEASNVRLEKTAPLTSADKELFGDSGVNAKIFPPLRILDPQCVFIREMTAIREGCHFNAFRTCPFCSTMSIRIITATLRRNSADTSRQLMSDVRYRSGASHRCLARDRSRLSATSSYPSGCSSATITTHFSHPDVPIMQQPNQQGKPVMIGHGSWVGVGAAILAGTRLGQKLRCRSEQCLPRRRL
jgi:acetyltransferase-like isoleucine patch superfamily enzyme